MEKNKKYSLNERIAIGIKTGISVFLAIIVGSILLAQSDYFLGLNTAAAMVVRFLTYWLLAWVILLGFRYVRKRI